MTCYLWTRQPPDPHAAKYRTRDGIAYTALGADREAATCSRESEGSGLCEYHLEVAATAGKRFARVGRIHRSRFRDLTMWNGSNYAGLLLLEAFTRGAMAEARYEGKRDGMVAMYVDTHPVEVAP